MPYGVGMLLNLFPKNKPPELYVFKEKKTETKTLEVADEYVCLEQTVQLVG